MIRFSRKHLGLALLFLLLITSTWITLSTRHALRHGTTSQFTIDAYLKNTEYKQFNRDGQLVVDLHSPYATLNKTEHQLQASTPKLIAYSKDNTKWFIEGDQLITDTVTHTTLLRGHVSLHRPQTAKSGSLTLTTDHMTLYPEDKAETDAPVTLVEGNGSTTHSIGCILNLKTNTIQLLSNTEALLVPNRKGTQHEHAGS